MTGSEPAHWENRPVLVRLLEVDDGGENDQHNNEDIVNNNEGGNREIDWTAILTRLEFHPEEARWVDADSQITFLHLLLCGNNHPTLEVIYKTIDILPETLDMAESYGALPLHYACDLNFNNGVEIVHAILNLHPEAAKCKTVNDHFPFHWAMDWVANGSRSEELSKLMQLLSPNRIAIVAHLLDAYPAAALEEDHFISMDCWEILCHAWTVEINEDSAEYGRLCELTELVLRARFIARKQLLEPDIADATLTEAERYVSYSPLPAICAEDHTPLNIPRLHRYMLRTHSRDASRHDSNGRLCLHVALEHNHLWNRTSSSTSASAIEGLYNVASKSIATRDLKTHLYPFMCAAVVSDCSSTVFELLRAWPYAARGLAKSNLVGSDDGMNGVLHIESLKI
uniref:Ankyrin repeat protein n=1 Tax=Leptocylindrus danicus TaxID=163516 RepID=A0A7S2LQ20_9STRA|mmetsp:Transcript_8573/g.12727  ORF Transcript_8573/g.12727 Transcript_8573/m.12727 type:complete len:398 (+) Transcript_8573:96-1289(+)